MKYFLMIIAALAFIGVAQATSPSASCCTGGSCCQPGNACCLIK